MAKRPDGIRRVAGEKARCPRCGSRLESRRVPVRGYTLPVAFLLAGSVLTNYLVGFVLLAIGIVYAFRRRDRAACPSCEVVETGIATRAGNRA